MSDKPKMDPCRWTETQLLDDEAVDPEGIEDRCRCSDECVEEFLVSPEGMALLAHVLDHLLDDPRDQGAQQRLEGPRLN